MSYIQIIVAVVLAVVGWVVAHRFTSARDLKNARSTTRIEILTECYKAFVRSGIDGVMVQQDKTGNVVNNAILVENAITLVHLHGTQVQSELASKYAEDVSNTGSGNSTKLVNSLRDDIREMLGERKLEGLPNYLGVTVNNSSNRTPTS